MLLAAFAHKVAFDYKEYLEETNLSHLPLNYGFKSVFFAEDVLEEVKLSISPPELDFELQN